MNEVEDIKKFAEFFILTRQEVLEKRDEDIADDLETLFTWFSAIFMKGFNEARYRNILDQAGVEDIERYLKTLED